MSEQKQGIYEFHKFQLDIGKGVLLRENQPVNLQWKTFELLCVFVKSDGKLITRDELMDELWADTFVEENNLRQHISALRKALGEGENGALFIETVPRRGYRFLPEVRILETADEAVFAKAKPIKAALAENILDKSDFVPLTVVQPTATSQVAADNEAKILAFPAPENSVKAVSNDKSAEDLSNEQSENKQETIAQPQTSKRRRGVRRGLKFLLWGLGIGFGFLILIQILQIFTIILFGTNKIPKELQERLGTLIGTLSIPVALIYAFGIGLFLFGIFRLLYAVFEKENSKLGSSLVEKLIAVIVTGIIAAVAIPNLLYSYRRAKEFQQSEMNKSSQKQINSIAVLPLKSLSSNPEDEELRVRITDALITKLGGLKDVATRPTDSVLRFSKSEQSALEIGKKLEVDAVLDGRIQREGERLRVTLQLVSVLNGEQIWSEQFDGQTNQILNLQDAISAKVLKTLNQDRQQTIEFTARPTQNDEAYEAYLKARYFVTRVDGKNLLKAIEYYKQAADLDPQFAEGYAGMADAQFRLYSSNFDVNKEHIVKSRQNLQKALAIKPDLFDALLTLGYIQTVFEWDWDAAEKTFKRAIEINPSSTLARVRYGILLTTMRRFEEAQSQLEQAVKLNPTYAGNITNLGMLYYSKKDYGQAEQQFRKALELDEKWTHASWLMARTLWMQGKKDEAVKYIVNSHNLNDRNLFAKLIEDKAKSSAPDEVIRYWLNKMEENPEHRKGIDGARWAMSVGDRETALRWLEKGFEERHPAQYLISAEPGFEPLRSEPRFQEILRKMNLL